MASKSRLQKKREKESLKQAVKYLFLIFLVLVLMVKLGLPGLIKMAAFLGDIKSSDEPIEKSDEVAPVVPKFEFIPEATFSAEIDLLGYGEIGSSVQLYIRGISADETVIDNDGEFVFTSVHLREGENEIYAIARDDQGNESNDSRTWFITLDTTAPLIRIDSPTKGQKFFDKDSPINVSGITEKGASLTVNGRFVMAKSDGGFETSLNLSEGDNEIEVISVDDAGNETRQALIVNYTP